MIKDLNVNDYYFHSIIHGAEEGLQVIDNIIKMGAIKSPQSLGTKARIGCHDKSDICLSHITKSNILQGTISCFDIYVPRLISFVIDREVSKSCQLYKPANAPIEEIILTNYEKKTNLYDEYRTKKDIPIEYIKGVCIPYYNLVENPLIFIPFIVEDILMGYYNGTLDNYTINLILQNEMSKEAYDKRVVVLNKYIDNLEHIFEIYKVNIPIYYYENESSPKLILR